MAVYSRTAHCDGSAGQKSSVATAPDRARSGLWACGKSQTEPHSPVGGVSRRRSVAYGRRLEMPPTELLTGMLQETPGDRFPDSATLVAERRRRRQRITASRRCG